MLVQDVMQSPVITVSSESTIADAYRAMHDRSVRHLPVVDDGALVGMVTDRDLRYATSRLHPSPVEAETPVERVMTTSVITAGPLDPVEEAARLLRARRIGSLPVIDGPNLVGIVTVTNLLDAVIRLTGLEKPGGRLAVSLDDEPGQLARLTSRVAEAGLDIRSVLSYYEDETDGHESAPPAPSDSERAETASDTLDADEAAYPDAAYPDAADPRLRVILRVDTLNIRPLAQQLREEGFRVVWPVAKPS